MLFKNSQLINNLKMKENNLESNEFWHKKLTDKQYRILRLKQTEPPFTGEYLKNKEHGIYYCAGCGVPLFKSDSKFNSGCGWPSFFSGIEENIDVERDFSHGMIRDEILCSKCGGHLGHVFNDGPEPTGKRYCVNSSSLKFWKE
ncbi:MAG: peptide-methionine (R)-S-oxide reductase MsrB [Promethearchaeota archaeon]